MSNRSRFLKALDESPEAVQKLASLAEKVASLQTIYQRRPMSDPLDNPDLGPERAGNNIERGRNIGKLVGAVGGGALGGLAGHALGGGLLSGATNLGDAVGSHLPGYDENMAHTVHDGFTDFGKVEGTASGALAGGLLGHSVGGHIGAGLGRASMNFASPEARAAERIKRMDPSTALAHIKMTEQFGHASPSEIAAMKDAYNTRRGGLRTQLESGVAIPPGERPVDVGSKPTAMPI